MPTTTISLQNIDPSVPTALQYYSGANQKVAPSTAFAAALVARVINGLGNGIPGISVTFTAPASGATCTFAGTTAKTYATNASGFATTDIPLANATLGTYNVVASSAGLAPSITYALTNGIPYLPEVCTSLENIPTPRTSTIGSSGSPVDWTNPQLASAAAMGASYAFIFQPTPNTNRSNALFANPAPASWLTLPIKDDALITSFSFSLSYYWFSNGSGSGIPVLTYGFTRGGSQIISGQGLATPLADAWKQVINQKVTFTSGQVVTGADLKLGSTAMNINLAPNSTQVAGSQLRLNGWQMSICYTNVDPGPPDVNIPLLINPS